jgi:hypothetical protein
MYRQYCSTLECYVHWTFTKDAGLGAIHNRSRNEVEFSLLKYTSIITTKI